MTKEELKVFIEKLQATQPQDDILTERELSDWSTSQKIAIDELKNMVGLMEMGDAR